MSELTQTEIKELLAGVTEGEWKVGPDVPFQYRADAVVYVRNTAIAKVMFDLNAKFIAAAPSIVRNLLAQLVGYRDAWTRVAQLEEGAARGITRH